MHWSRYTANKHSRHWWWWNWGPQGSLARENCNGKHAHIFLLVPCFWKSLDWFIINNKYIYTILIMNKIILSYIFLMWLFKTSQFWVDNLYIWKNQSIYCNQRITGKTNLSPICPPTPDFWMGNIWTDTLLWIKDIPN